MKVSTALRLARERAGMTQAQLGRRVGYSANMVSAVECGDRVLAPDVAARTRDLLDDPELYMAMAEEATGGVMVPIVLDGPRVDLHRMSTGRKAIEEFSEAIRALAQGKFLINAQGPEDLRDEDRVQLRAICRETLQAATAAVNTVRVMCLAYGLSPREISLEHIRDLERKGYITTRGVTYSARVA